MKQVLLIGLEPTLIKHGYEKFSNLDPQKVLEGIKNEIETGLNLGYKIEPCFINPDGSDIGNITKKISQKQFDCIVIGAGIRIIPEHLLLFEKVINLVHQNVPDSRICFNTNPTDTVEAINRMI